MEQRIRLTRHELVANAVSAALWIGVTSYFVLGALDDSSPWAIVLIAILLVGLVYYARLFSLTAILRGDRLFVRNWFGSHEFDRSEIEGFRTAPRFPFGRVIRIDLPDGSTKKISVTDTYDMFGDTDALREEQAAALEEWRMRR